MRRRRQSGGRDRRPTPYRLSPVRHAGLDLSLELLSLSVIVRIRQRLRAQVHGGGQQRDDVGSEGGDFGAADGWSNEMGATLYGAI
ncbi:MAG: hypothetical protein L0387_08120 [Acidobacteria bacterium]|nr:hypothetical protein [Acidobacteriota bacterium]MCI0723934.1 hypothetical protein [Acidobacteriota bacterium]